MAQSPEQRRADLDARIRATRVSPEREPQTQGWQSGGFGGDSAVSIARGAAMLPGAATGLADIGAAALGFDRPFDRATDAVGSATGFQPGEWGESLQDRYSPQMQASQQAVEEGWERAGDQWDAGQRFQAAGSAIGSYLRNPRSIQALVGESLPATVAGGLAGRGLIAAAGTRPAATQLPRATGSMRPAPQAAPSLAPATSRMTEQARLSGTAGGAIGQGPVFAGMTMDQIDDEVPAGRAALAATGVGVGAIGAAYGGAAVSRWAGLADPETIIAGGGRGVGGVLTPDTPVRQQRNILARMTGGAASEGILQDLPQEAIEQMGKNWAEGKGLYDNVPRASIEGMLAGAAMGAGVNIPGPVLARGNTTDTKLTDRPNTVVDGGEGSAGIESVDNEKLFSSYEIARSVADNAATQHPQQAERALGIMQSVLAELERRGVPQEAVSQDLASRRYQKLASRRASMWQEYQKKTSAQRPQEAQEVLGRMQEVTAEMERLQEFYTEDQLFPQEVQQEQNIAQRAQEIAGDSARVLRARDGRLRADLVDRLADFQALDDSALTETILNGRESPRSLFGGRRALAVAEAVAEQRGLTIQDPADAPTTETDALTQEDTEAGFDPSRSRVINLPPDQMAQLDRMLDDTEGGLPAFTEADVTAPPQTATPPAPLDAELNRMAQETTQAQGVAQSPTVASRAAQLASPTRVTNQSGVLFPQYQRVAARFEAMSDSNLRNALRSPNTGRLQRAIAQAVAEERGVSLDRVQGATPAPQQRDLFAETTPTDLTGQAMPPTQQVTEPAPVDQSIEATQDMFAPEQGALFAEQPVPAEPVVETPAAEPVAGDPVAARAVELAEGADIVTQTGQLRRAYQQMADNFAAMSDADLQAEINRPRAGRIQRAVAQAVADNREPAAEAPAAEATPAQEAPAAETPVEAPVEAEAVEADAPLPATEATEAARRTRANQQATLDDPQLRQLAETAWNQVRTQTENEALAEWAEIEQNDRARLDFTNTVQSLLQDHNDNRVSAEMLMLGLENAANEATVAWRNDAQLDALPPVPPQPATNAEQMHGPEDATSVTELAPHEVLEHRRVVQVTGVMAANPNAETAQRAASLADRLHEAELMRLAGSMTAAEFMEVVRETREDLRGTDTAFQRRVDPNDDAQPLPLQETTEIVQDLMAPWQERPDVYVVANELQLPQPVLDYMAQQNAFGEVSAVMHEGAVYVVGDKMHNRAAVEEAILHEVKGHFGLRVMMGQELNSLLQQVYNQFQDSPMAAEVRRNYTLDETNQADRLRFAEEMLAHLAEDNPSPSLLQRVIVAINQGLRRLGFQIRMNRAELISLMHRAGQTVENGGIVRGPLAGAEVVFQRAIPQENAAYREQQGVFMQQYNNLLDRAPSGVQAAIRGSRDAVRQFFQSGMFTHDLVDFVGDLLPSLRAYSEKTRNQVSRRGELLTEIQNIVDPVKNWSHARREQMNDVLKNSTMAERWAYQPSWLGRTVQVDPDLNRQWLAMDDQQREIADNMFHKAQDLHQHMYELAEAEIKRSYNEMIERAPTQATKDKHRRAMAKALADLSQKARATREAYLPLRRWGDYVLVYRSQAFRRAQKTGTEADVRRMKGDASHYMVFFADTAVGARKLKADMEAHYQQQGRSVTFDEPFQRMETNQASELVPYDIMQRLQNEAAVSDNETINNQLKDAINKLYIQSLADNTARKAELERLNIEGGGTDMVRAFADHGSSMAAIMSSLELNADTRKLLAQLKEEATDPDKPRRADRMAALNEVLKRHALLIQNQENPVQQRIMGVTSVWMLLTSPAYYIQNSTQPWMLTMPYLAGVYGASAANSQMLRAYKHVRQLHRQRKNGTLVDFSELNNENSPNYDPGLHDLFTRLQRLGILDVGMALDLGSLKHGRSKIENTVGAVHEKMITAVRTVELYNRGVTAMATYRLALNQARAGEVRDNQGNTIRMNDAEAVEHAQQAAVDAVMKTQGDYSGLNAPRLISQIPAGRVLTQFRKFQLIQMGILARTVYNSFKGESTANKAIARRQLGYILGMHGMVGGALGLPAANLISWVLAHAFGDEDEPANAELLARRAIGNKQVADLVLRGLPAWAGVDTSTRLGMGLTFAVLPFNDIEASRDGMLTYAGALLTGPAGGALGRGASGIGMIRDGELALGVANMMPSLVQNGIKAAVYHTDGIQTRGGDTAITAEDLSWWDLATQAAGWPSKKISDRYFATNALRDVDNHFRNRTSAIKRAYIDASDRGDRADMNEAISEFMRLQQMRRQYKAGDPQSISVLLRAPRERREREALMVEGVPTRRTNQRFVQELFD